MTAVVRPTTYTQNFDVRAYGAVGNGTTDDTAAFVAALAAAPAGATVFIPTGLFKISAALVITKNVTIEGAGIAEVAGTDVATDYSAGPRTAPYLQGSVILQTAAATDVIQIPGTGLNVHLRNFGIRFDDPIRFLNTGHGIYAVPSATVSGGLENGINNCLWENVVVFGHDGDHYAFYLVNLLGTTHIRLRGHGGGGLYLGSNCPTAAAGNSTLIDPCFDVFVGGSANGITLYSGAIPAGSLNLLTIIRPAVGISAVPSAFAGLGITAPSIAQYLWRNIGGPQNIDVIDPDLEGYAYVNPIDFGGIGGGTHVRNGSVLSNSPVGGIDDVIVPAQTRIGYPTADLINPTAWTWATICGVTVTDGIWEFEAVAAPTAMGSSGAALRIYRDGTAVLAAAEFDATGGKMGSNAPVMLMTPATLIGGGHYEIDFQFLTGSTGTIKKTSGGGDPLTLIRARRVG